MIARVYVIREPATINTGDPIKETSMESKRGPGRPATGSDPVHSVRMPDEDWDDLEARAETIGLDRAKVINALVRYWLRRPGAKLPKRPDHD